MNRRASRLCAATLAASLAAGTVPAYGAETEPAAGSATAPARASSTSEVDEARMHFQRGIEFFGEESYEAALVEFQRAYEIAPSYQILYNTGRIHAALKNYARALRDLRRYLSEGGDGVPDDRREQVLQLTRSLEQKVATLQIVSGVPGVHISIDDVPIGDAPISGFIVNPGDRRVTASKEGYYPSTVVVTVVATEARKVSVSPTRVAQSRVIMQRASVAPVIAWAATGVLVAGSAAAGIVALNAEKKLNDRKDSEVGGGAGAFEDDASKVRNWAIATDALAVGAVVAAGVSVYLTFFNRSSKAETPSRGLGANSLVVTPRNVALRGTF